MRLREELMPTRTVTEERGGTIPPDLHERYLQAVPTHNRLLLVGVRYPTALQRTEENVFRKIRSAAYFAVLGFRALPDPLAPIRAIPPSLW